MPGIPTGFTLSEYGGFQTDLVDLALTLLFTLLGKEGKIHEYNTLSNRHES